MTLIPDEIHTNEQLQQLVAKEMPSVMELDPSNEADAQTILVCGQLLVAMKEGGNIELTSEDKDGRSETLSIQTTGANTSGDPTASMSIASSDGRFAPETVDMAAALALDGHLTEINRLTGGD